MSLGLTPKSSVRVSLAPKKITSFSQKKNTKKEGLPHGVAKKITGKQQEQKKRGGLHGVTKKIADRERKGTKKMVPLTPRERKGTKKLVPLMTVETTHLLTVKMVETTHLLTVKMVEANAIFGVQRVLLNVRTDLFSYTEFSELIFFLHRVLTFVSSERETPVCG